ncbi:MAG: nucleotidyltransferase family protein [Rhodopila sp.]
MDHSPPLTATVVIDTLRAHRKALERAGVAHLSLFGSVARDEAGPESDIDLAAEFDPAARMDLFRLIELEYELSDLLGRRVEILPEPISKERLRANVERDRIRAF